MHRGASLALGRCEGDGLRCIYHGWKYATDGSILETPNYKKAGLRERLKAPVHPVREAGGVIWGYLRAPQKGPPFPHHTFMDSPHEQAIYHTTVDCNYLQLLEGLFDRSHNLVLHQDPDKMGTYYGKGSEPDPVLGNQPITEIAADVYSGGVEAVDFVCDDRA